MNWPKFIAVALLLSGLAWAEPKQRSQRPHGARTTGSAASEQTAIGPGTISRQGKYWVEEINGSVPAAPRLRIECDGGGIELRGAEQQDITYRVVKKVAATSEENARRALAEFTVRVQHRGETVFLIAESTRGHNTSADWQVTAPRRTAQADLETRGGGISARDIEGSVRMETAGGAVGVDGIGGSADLQTAGGVITIGTVRGRVRAETAGGAIKLTSGGSDVFLTTHGGDIEVGRAERSVRAETAGGSIRVSSAGGDVTAQTAGGSINVGEAARVIVATAGGGIQVEYARALVRAETAAGSIRLVRVAGPVRAETASGNILANIAATREAWAESVLETASGDILVTLPKDLALTVRAAIKMASGRNGITSDFPLTMRSAERPGPREVYAEGPINGGGAALRLRTVSGNIEIRSQK